MGSKRVRPLPSVKALRAALAYSPTTGELRWRVRKNPQVKVGQIAGYIDAHGYRTVQFDGVGLKAHRLIWAMQTGRWPSHDVDHEDTDPANNRWGNLRKATNAQNGRNRRGPNANNGLGLLGIFRTPSGTYQIAVRATFKSLHAAKRARSAAAKALHGAFASRVESKARGAKSA